MKQTEEEYKETLDWLYSQLPMFSRIGAAAYKPGLETTIELDEYFGSPHRKFKTIHIGGTNGKGSTSYMLASVLQQQGYKTGLYTSPHLVDFRERIRINGKMIPKEAVIDFVRRWKGNRFERKPSFFELTMMMAFDRFALEEVDIAVIEVGMGGRLDSTNVIRPEVSVVTNISFDHTQFLGTTLKEIAFEKAGIIKEKVPVVIGEYQEETADIFKDVSSSRHSPLTFADKTGEVKNFTATDEGWECLSETFGRLEVPLRGDYQKKNITTAIETIKALRKAGIEIGNKSVEEGLRNVIANTALAGRWQTLGQSPLTICDTGHNKAGLEYNLSQLLELQKKKGGKLRMVIGFVNDKDVEGIAALFPQDAEYYFTQAGVPRAMPAERLEGIFSQHGLKGKKIPMVKEAYEKALGESGAYDVIYVGGSTFVVADFLA